MNPLLIKNFLKCLYSFKYDNNKLDLIAIGIDSKANCIQKHFTEDLIKDFVIVDESVTGLFAKKERLE